MIDFQIVSAKTLLPVESIAPIRGFLPPSIVVLGTNLNQAQEVYFNGVKVSEFIVASPNRLIVRIPDSQVGNAFQSIQAYAIILDPNQNASLSLAILRPVQTIQGIARLVQSWVMVFMTTPGSDIFSPNSGGGGQALVGRNTDGKGSGVSADIAAAIQRTNDELVRLQAQISNIPLAEKLLSSNLQALSFDSSTTTLEAQVSLKNMVGQAAQVTLSG
jgi:hypothetical protein